MGNCYLFNPANAVAEIALNSGALGPIAPAEPNQSYTPQSISVPTARHEDVGVLGIAEPNVLSAYYPDDPDSERGPYTVEICLAGRNVSVDDDVVIYVGRASAVVLTARGFVVDASCDRRLNSESIKI